MIARKRYLKSLSTVFNSEPLHGKQTVSSIVFQTNF